MYGGGRESKIGGIERKEGGRGERNWRGKWKNARWREGEGRRGGKAGTRGIMAPLRS